MITNEDNAPVFNYMNSYIYFYDQLIDTHLLS